MGLEHLLPRRKEGWAELLFLLAIVFVFHYVGFFKCLHRSYDRVAHIQDSKKPSSGEMQVKTSFPAYFADFDEVYVYVDITNNSPDNMFWVHVYPVKCDGSHYDYDIDFLNNDLAAEILPLYPKETKSMRLPLYSAAGTRSKDSIICTVRIAKIRLAGNGEIIIDDIVPKPSDDIQGNEWAVLSLKIIGQLLLSSPWSNVVLVTLVIGGRYFFSIYQEVDDDKKKKFPFILDMLGILVGIALIYEFGLILMYIPLWKRIDVLWQDQGGVLASWVGGISLLIAIMFIGVIGYIEIVRHWKYNEYEYKQWEIWGLFFSSVGLILLGLLKNSLLKNNNSVDCPLFFMGAALGCVEMLKMLPKVFMISIEIFKMLPIIKRFLSKEPNAKKASKDARSQDVLEGGKGEQSSSNADNVERELKDASSSLKNSKDEEKVV